MTLTAKLLICPIWQKAYIVKLKAIGKKETRQRAVLGSTIAFMQENVLLKYSKLPHALSELSRSLSVIFVGSTPPSDAQLAKVFSVDSKDLKTVLDEFLSNGHGGFQHGTFNMEEIETFESDTNKGIQDLLKDCIHSVDAESERTVDRETRSYADNIDGPGDAPLPDNDVGYESEEVFADDGGEYEDGDILLHPCGLVNSNGFADDREERDKRAIDVLRVGHHEDPVNTYGNPQYWVNSMPWLFPFGVGGAEAARPADLSLVEWVRHCLCYYDDRFRKDPAFIFIVYH
jgi:hypothetical protein